MSDSVSPAAAPLVEMIGITKRFGSNIVLQDVSFNVRAGETHILAGENGAGKSTLIKILGGIHTDFEGTIRLQGREVRPRTPLHANELGIAIIHQELSLIGPMSSADNMFLGRNKATAGWVHNRVQEQEAAKWLTQLGLDIDPRQPIEQYSIAVRQCIEIAKALSQQARVLIMDEPTSALQEPEVERLFQLIEQLKQQGCGIVYITHKMEEIGRIADRITVLRDGKLVGTEAAVELPAPKLIRWMVGRELGEQFPRRDKQLGTPRLEIKDFSVFPKGRSAAPTVRRASFTISAGEIVGVGGLQGSGASDLFLGLFGAYGNHVSGNVKIDGRAVTVNSPRRAIETGLALLTSDRKATGLVLRRSIVENIALPSLSKIARRGWRRPAAEQRVAAAMAEKLCLRAASLEMPVADLSGGNQQKVAIAKWLETNPRVLLLDEPTRGIDIGAKREIYELMHQLTQQGMALLLITSEMSELLALSDRVIVMHRGRIMADMPGNVATPDNVLAAAMGGHEANGPSSTPNDIQTTNGSDKETAL